MVTTKPLASVDCTTGKCHTGRRVAVAELPPPPPNKGCPTLQPLQGEEIDAADPKRRSDSLFETWMVRILMFYVFLCRSRICGQDGLEE